MTRCPRKRIGAILPFTLLRIVSEWTNITSFDPEPTATVLAAVAFGSGLNEL